MIVLMILTPLFYLFTDFSDLQYVSLLSNGSLLLKPTADDKIDSFNVKCVASNGVGVPLEKAIRVTVIGIHAASINDQPDQSSAFISFHKLRLPLN